MSRFRGESPHKRSAARSRLESATLPPRRRCPFGHSAKLAASNYCHFPAQFLFGFAQAQTNKKRDPQRDQIRCDKYFEEAQQSWQGARRKEQSGGGPGGSGPTPAAVLMAARFPAGLVDLAASAAVIRAVVEWAPSAVPEESAGRPAAACVDRTCGGASMSDWPPERKAIPGTATGTQFFKTVNVA